MASAPELPFLGAGALALVGGVRREGHLPHNATVSIVGTIVLVLATSATAGTKIAPLVRAIGVLLLVASVYGVVRAFQVKPLPPVNAAKLRAVERQRTPGNSNSVSGLTSGTSGGGVAGGGGGGF